jgi:hypothetical protein
MELTNLQHTSQRHGWCEKVKRAKKRNYSRQETLRNNDDIHVHKEHLYFNAK